MENLNLYRLTVLMWVLDYIDTELVTPILAPDKLKLLSFELVANFLPKLDPERKVPPPPNDLTFDKLLTMLKEVK
jgi:hypothetical protein